MSVEGTMDEVHETIGKLYQAATILGNITPVETPTSARAFLDSAEEILDTLDFAKLQRNIEMLYPWEDENE